MEPGVLEHILRRIDENLAWSPQLEVEAAPEHATVPMIELIWRLQNLQLMQAPLFVVKGRGWRDQLKRIANLPIRLFGHKQISFNHELLELLELWLNTLQQQQLTADQLARQAERIRDLEQQVRQLAERLGEQ